MDRACTAAELDLGADGVVREAGEHPRGEPGDERGHQDQHGEPDGGTGVVADPPQREAQPAHRYSSLARRTALVRADGSCRIASTTVARTSTAARTSGGDGGLRRDDDHGGGHRRLAGRGERGERQHEPGEHEPQQRAEHEARDQQREVLDRQPQEQLARREPQRLEQRELADPLRDRDGRAHEEADRREHERGQRAEAEDPDHAEPQRVAREVGRHRRPVDDRRGAQRGRPERGVDRRGLGRVHRQPPFVRVEDRPTGLGPGQAHRQGVDEHERLGLVERREGVHAADEVEAHGDAEDRRVELVADLGAGPGEERRVRRASGAPPGCAPDRDRAGTRAPSCRRRTGTAGPRAG